jgi:hypothetical protein
MVYDGSNNRVSKRIGDTNAQYYIRDAEGKTLAVYDNTGKLLFWNLYAGSKNIGKRLP